MLRWQPMASIGDDGAVDRQHIEKRRMAMTH